MRRLPPSPPLAFGSPGTARLYRWGPAAQRTSGRAAFRLYRRAVPSRTLAVLNQKGGVGKTTTTANLGAAAAALGRRVLAIDLDPQANLTAHLGVDPREPGRTIYDVLRGACGVADAVRRTAVAGLSLLPSHLDLSVADVE